MKQDTSSLSLRLFATLFSALLFLATGSVTAMANDDEGAAEESPENGADTSPPAETEADGNEAVIEEPADDDEEWERLARGLRYRDINVGDGDSPDLWANVFVHYRIYSETGILLEDTFAQRNPQRFTIGSGLMPAPLELAVKTMKERGRRELLIPAEMFQPEDFQHHADEHGGDLSQVEASLRPGMLLRAELSLMWVRQYDPADRHRFR